MESTTIRKICLEYCQTTPSADEFYRGVWTDECRPDDATIIAYATKINPYRVLNLTDRVSHLETMMQDAQAGASVVIEHNFREIIMLRQAMKVWVLTSMILAVACTGFLLSWIFR